LLVLLFLHLLLVLLFLHLLLVLLFLHLLLVLLFLHLLLVLLFLHLLLVLLFSAVVYRYLQLDQYHLDNSHRLRHIYYLLHDFLTGRGVYHRHSWGQVVQSATEKNHLLMISVVLVLLFLHLLLVL
jgi:hypothetical protein